MSRSSGILCLQMHSDDGPLVWGAAPGPELARAFADVAQDPENEVVILTGTGDAFCERWIPSATSPSVRPHQWDLTFGDSKRMLMNHLDIPVPMIGAINGPATVHAELGLLCDIVIAADTAIFGDHPHYPMGLVPGDGVHVVWPLLLGPNRGRYFILTGQSIDAKQALSLGIVAEVLSRDALLPRARDLAALVAEQPPLTRRYAREALTQRLKREMLADLGYGLTLEGMAAAEYWPSGRSVEPSGS